MGEVSRVPERWDLEVDLVSVGSSSGGLMATILGHDLGLRTLLLEKSDFLGGGTALSGGVFWIPFNHIMLEQGLADSREEALTHIRHTGLGRHDEELTAAYLDTGPEVIRYIEERTPLRLTIEASPDYYAELPGGKKRGRQLYPDPEHMIPMLQEAEKAHPLVAKVRRDPVPFFLGVREPWSEGRGLIGGLVLGCVERGIDVRTGIRARRLIVEEGRVIGLRAEHEGKDFFVKAHKGVLLASGGYEWNAEMNKRFMSCPSLFPFSPSPNEGDGHIMGMEVGAAVALMDHSIFQPVYYVEGEEAEGKPLYRPLSYGYPGNILVNRHGERCCNESFYPDIGRAFLAYDKLTSELAHVPIFWIADQENVDGSGMGILAKMTKHTDWLVKADTLPELAERLGIPADHLDKTISRFNEFAREGKDPDFHRGEGAYQHYWGQRGAWAGREPSATLGPLQKPPFYGIKLQLGTVGNLGGLVVNPHAQVINTQGEVIPGLYGTSNTTALLTHGFMYTSGACQAKSLIFGYIAARHMASM
jgi:succinate dehydrogenase/fumarate reductase flavoprotein subunit